MNEFFDKWGLTIAAIFLGGASAAVGNMQKDKSTQKAVEKHFKKQEQEERKRTEGRRH